MKTEDEMRIMAIITVAFMVLIIIIYILKHGQI